MAFFQFSGCWANLGGVFFGFLLFEGFFGIVLTGVLQLNNIGENWEGLGRKHMDSFKHNV